MKATPGATHHFVGIGGAGMSALAQFHAMSGEAVTGSDRLLDRGELADLRAALARLGIRFFPQDGSGVGPGTRQVTVSTAIEDAIPDVLRARELGVPVVHRTDELARHVAANRSIAVAGTSGKSTVTAMIYEILAASGDSPSLITGAGLRSLAEKGFMGNAWKGASDLLVIEADESDGTLPKYAPWLGVLLSLGKDHKELSELEALFRQFKDRSKRFVVNADAGNLAGFREGSVTFGFNAGDVRGRDLEMDGGSCRFTVSGTGFSLAHPGLHNAMNALAALAACLQAGVSLEAAAAALAAYKGISRRFEVVGSARGVEVVDDYAHNPDKVRAVLAAARLRSPRLLVVYQPHGFYPTRFLKHEFIEAFSAGLKPGDVLWFPDIYYVGGTTVKDIHSGHLAEPLRGRGLDARYVPDRAAIIPEIAAEGREGDLVLVLGARDPSLSSFAKAVLDALGATA